MRLDVFLKRSRLVPRRTVAKRLCEAGNVQSNGKPAKASAEVAVGDTLEIAQGIRTRKVRVLELPSEQVSRRQAAELYELLSEEIDHTHQLL